MNCQHCKENMFEYFETALLPHMKEEIEQHLQLCDSCRRQYDFTRLETQILQDTTDIPVIDAAFNHNVMTLITAGVEPAAVLISDQKSRRFSWLPVYSKAAAAVALLAICLYVPGIIPERQGEQAQNSNPLRSTQSYGSVSKTFQQDSMKAKVAYDKSLKESANLDQSTYNSKISPVQPDSQETTDPALAGNVNSADFMATTRSVQPEAAPTESANADRIGLQNIPVEFILTQTNQVAENQMEYHYGTQDGSQNFVIQLAIIEPKVKTAARADKPAIDSSAVSSLKAATLGCESKREIVFDGLIYQLLVSGNLSQEELDHLASDIILSKEPCD